MPYYTTKAPKKTVGGGCGCGGSCSGGGCGGSCGGSCGGGSSCRGLSTMERPRYFSGQLLTEDELGSEQAYVLAKNRLHNRYLHGWGIVCGLQLTCDECPGYVAIHPGYGLDPCGNDVVVPCVQHYDLLRAIRDCEEATRRRGCDPYGQVDPNNCQQESQHWCVSVRYTEQQRRPSTALRQTAMSSGCGCSSGPAPSGGCGCGTRAPATPAKSSATYGTSSNLLLGACEPSRVVEGYSFSVCRSDGHCPDPAEALKNTFVGRIVACFTGLLDLAKTRLDRQDGVVIASAFTGTSSMGRLSPAEQYAALCRFRNFTLDVLDGDAFGLSCGLPCAGYDIVIPQPDPNNESSEQYAERSAEALRGMVALLLEHLRQCLCQALEPPCGPDPGGDSIPLGCVVVNKDDIVSVCSLSGRHYAGSFPALAYWLSLGPVIAAALCRVCCTPVSRGGRARRNALFTVLDSVDPTGGLRKAAGTQGFAAPRYYANQAKRLWRGVALARLLKRVRVPEDGVNVASYLDQSPTKARAALKAAGLTVTRVRVDDEAAAPAVAMLTVPPLVRPGGQITLYEHDGAILGYTLGSGGPEDDQ